jgi:CRP-like cAMP-binding protein
MKNEARNATSTLPASTDPVIGNRLLAILPVHERNAVHRASSLQSFAAGETLLSPGLLSEHVIFPNDLVVSLVRTMRDGRTMELAMIGNEGVIGADAFMETRQQPDRALVLNAGSAYCMPAHEVRRHFDSGAILRRHLLRAASGVNAQVAQNAVCAHFHEPATRLARWLLVMRTRTQQLRATADKTTIASLLGITSAQMDGAIADLVRDGLVRVSQNRITISDRDGLELGACECYETLRPETDFTLAS